MFLQRKDHDGRELFGPEADREILRANGLDGFESIWSLKAPWVEEPNIRRQGWSGVSRIELNDSTLPPEGVFLKRQEGHCYRSLRPPFVQRPTAYREYRSLLTMKALSIAVPEVIYYGERRVSGAWQAVLMTREIPQSISFEDYMQQASARPRSEVERIICDTASLIGNLHRQHFEHCALYGKHVLISGFKEGRADVPHASRNLVPCLIDLEKSRFRSVRWRTSVRELSQFYRHNSWETWQWDTFVDRYMTVSRFRGMRSILPQLIERKIRRKQRQYLHHRREQ